MRLTFEVNGVPRELDVDPGTRLIDVLRLHLGLTGTKEACGEGECGACTVLVDGKAVNSCLSLAPQVQGKQVLTVEGLGHDGELDELQRQFIEHGAVQCGYCTPGMLMSAKALLLVNRDPSEQEIRTALAGNLCRCTGYAAIVAAVSAAAALPHAPAPAVDAPPSIAPGGPSETPSPGLMPLLPEDEEVTAMSVAPTAMRRPTLLAPRSRVELTADLRQMTPNSRFLAGGTDLVRAMTKEGVRPDLLVHLGELDELRGVTADNGLLRVGSMTTFAQLQADPLLRRHGGCLADAAAAVGSAQIRNAATVGGNVANASPCGDSIPALLALDAEAEIWDAEGGTTRRPVAEVVAGPGRTTLRPGELIAAFVFTALDEGQRSAFAKIGSRTAVTVARLSVAVVVGYEPESATFSTARVALGAVGETAFRDELVEASLAGRKADASTALSFAEACSTAVCRSIPGRYSLDYKCRAAVGLADDAWRALGFTSPADEPAEVEVRELVDRLLPELKRGAEFALLTVIEEQGSTPRAGGASMVVRADGSTTGTIGGGLLEATGLNAAAEAIARRTSAVVAVTLGGRDIEGPEIVCGGSATILVDYVPPRDAVLTAIATAIGALRPGECAWLLTACAAEPGDTEVSHWLWRDGVLVGDPSSGIDLRGAARHGRSRLTLPDGRRVYAELLEPAPAVIICGAGHVGQALAPVAAGVGFRVVVLDDRPEFADPRRFLPDTIVRVIPDFEDAFAGLTVDERSLIVVVTRSHRHDLTTLAQALQTPARYVGLMSSRAKRGLMLTALRERGFGDAYLERIHSPVGLAIGAETPAELAISIVAELIQVRSSWAGGRGTPASP